MSELLTHLEVLEMTAKELDKERREIDTWVKIAQDEVLKAEKPYADRIKRLEDELRAAKLEALNASDNERKQLGEYRDRRHMLQKGPHWEKLTTDLLVLQKHGLKLLHQRHKSPTDPWVPKRDDYSGGPRLSLLKISLKPNPTHEARCTITGPRLGDLAKVTGWTLEEALENGIQAAAKELERRIQLGH